MRQRIIVLVAAVLMALAGMVALTGATASAQAFHNSVVRTAFIWNCPTGVPACAAEQTRVGDIRTSDPITDICRVDNNPLNLAYNWTSRGGAANRTGFLYRENLANQSQTESCTSGGVTAAAPAGTRQRLCPFLACGSVATYDQGQRIRAFCYVDNDSTRFWLTTAFYPNGVNQGGPLTGGFMDSDDMDSFPGGGMPDCATLFG